MTESTDFASFTFAGESPVRRGLLILTIVCGLASLVNRFEASGQAGQSAAAASNDWVRTSEGWRRRRVLEYVAEPDWPALHPGLVAAFQLTASALALLAWSGKSTAVRILDPTASEQRKKKRIRISSKPARAS